MVKMKALYVAVAMAAMSVACGGVSPTTGNKLGPVWVGGAGVSGSPAAFPTGERKERLERNSV